MDLSGQVVDSAGKRRRGRRGECVHDTPADGDRRSTVLACPTDRTGTYTVSNLDGRVPRPRTPSRSTPSDPYQVEKGAYARMPRWIGGAQTYAGAQRRSAYPPEAPSSRCPLTGGIAGAVTSEVGLPVYRRWTSPLFDAKG